MAEFTKVKLEEYQSKLIGDNENRTVVIVAESADEAEAQLERFVDHLRDLSGEDFVASPLIRLEDFHLTFTDKAWELLKAAD